MDLSHTEECVASERLEISHVGDVMDEATVIYSIDPMTSQVGDTMRLVIYKYRCHTHVCIPYMRTSCRHVLP